MTVNPDSRPSRVALFGGSFDPVHLGHLGMAEKARGHLGLDRVLFVPCFVSPFKSGTVATPEQRLEMLRIVAREAGGDWLEVSDWELRREKPSFTWETAEHMRETEPAVEWYWILGTDQWEQIDRWAEPGKLRRLLRFLVFTREGDSVLHREGWDYTAVEYAHPASSTGIRRDFAARRDWLLPAVAEYCEREGMYDSRGG